MRELTKLNRCFECGKADTGNDARGGMCLECYCVILNKYMLPLNGRRRLGYDAARKKTISDINAMKSDAARQNYKNGFGRKITMQK